MTTIAEQITKNQYFEPGPVVLETKNYTYDRWMDSVGIPIHRGYFIEDLRTVELGWWDERQCNDLLTVLGRAMLRLTATDLHNSPRTP